jgi:hypothetical protein
MGASIPVEILDKLTTFGELLRYIRRRAGLTQTQLSIAVGYSEAMIVADSQVACASYGIARGSAQYDRCVQDEFAVRRPG